MANEAYGSGFNYDGLMTPLQAGVVYTAQEQSLYLPGTMVPMVEVPEGHATAQVALMGSVAADTITSEATPGVDFDAKFPGDTKKTIALELIAARSVLRDFGGVDVDNISRIMGNSIAAAVDTKVSAEMANLTQVEITTANLLNEFYGAIGDIRNAGEMGPLAAVISAAAYAEFMEEIGSSAYAGGDFQNAALRTGSLGLVAGVPCFVSAHLNDTNTGVTGTKAAIFSQDALRGATQGGVKLEVERRASAVGVDVVGSIAFGIETIDATRGVLLKDAV